ncbi:hypothetical protein CTP10_R56490 [Cupriavidus sp. P-10]|nr:hypothetical protein CTP10_R56490 [Cupriavidus sp. P-10]
MSAYIHVTLEGGSVNIETWDVRGCRRDFRAH